MLSYRHAFHAGNFADVLKHLVVAKTIEYLVQKPAPIMYIDTHAGAGQYQLNSDMSKKTAEHKSGISNLNFNALPESISIYREQVTPLMSKGIYPGSPLLAAQMLRKQDKLRLFELHSTEFPLLQEQFNRDRRVLVEKSDGFQALKALLPAPQKRALVLIDPSYEVKMDYQQVVEALKQGYRRMPNAHYLLWYPVVNRSKVDAMIKDLSDSGMRNVWRFELGIEADNKNRGMTSSGMIAINPPWVLADQLRELLPAVTQQLAPDSGYYVVEQLIRE